MTRPFADLLALRPADPRAIPDLEHRLRARFPDVLRPAPGWIVACLPLPGSPPPVRRGAAMFVEGGETFANDPPGDDSLASAPGDFTFVRFDGDGSVSAVRSPGGAAPLAVWHDVTSAAISTRLDWLVRWAIPDPQPDPLSVAMWACGLPYLPDGRLFVRGAWSVTPGTLIRIGNGGPVVRRWWQPPPSPPRIPPRAQIRERDEQFRALVLGGLDRDLDDKRDNLLTLSGGADSSTLAILAASRGKPLSALTLLTGSPAERERERAIIDAVVARVPLRAHQWIDANKERHSLTRGPLPVAFPVIHPALLALPRAGGDPPPATLVGGEFADEFWGKFAFPDWLGATTPAGLIRAAGRYPNDWKDPARWARARMKGPWSLRTELPAFVRNPIREEYREWRERRMSAARPGAWRAMSVRIDMFEPVAAMNWEACAAMGIRRVFPLVSRDLLELTFASHPAEFIGPGFKTRQRRAFRGLVPAPILDRPKAPFTGPEPDPIAPPDPALIQQIVDPQATDPVPGLAIHAFVEALNRVREAGPGPATARGTSEMYRSDRG